MFWTSDSIVLFRKDPIEKNHKSVVWVCIYCEKQDLSCRQFYLYHFLKRKIQLYHPGMQSLCHTQLLIEVLLLSSFYWFLTMCFLSQGLVMSRIRSSEIGPERTKYIYLGDGKGDYCPSIKLTNNDFVMPRKGYYLWKHIGTDPSLTKAEVHGWDTYEEFEEILLCLINKIMGNLNYNNSSQIS